MALTKEDLQAMRAMMREELEPVKEELGLVKEEQGLLKADLGRVKEDLGRVKEDLACVKEDLACVKEEQESMKGYMHRLNQNVAKIEVEHSFKLGALYDAHVDTVRNATTIRELDAKVENHDHRISALELKAMNG